MSPIWAVGGFFLGASSALIGRDAAMACLAVEEVIDKHYEDQKKN